MGRRHKRPASAKARQAIETSRKPPQKKRKVVKKAKRQEVRTTSSASDSSDDKDDNDVVYEVEKVKDMKIEKGKVLFLSTGRATMKRRGSRRRTWVIVSKSFALLKQRSERHARFVARRETLTEHATFAAIGSTTSALMISPCQSAWKTFVTLFFARWRATTSVLVVT